MSRPLWQIAAVRIVTFALAAAAAQMAIVFADYYLNDEELGRLLIEQQVEILSQGLTVSNGRVSYVLPETSGDLFEEDEGYYARVRTADGTVLFSACDATCTEHFLPLNLRPPDFWVRVITPGKPLSVAGGAAIDREGRHLLIEFATRRDSEGLMWGVFWHEVFDHLVVPMSLLLFFVMGGTIVSISAALRPARQAARAADHMDPLKADQGLPTRGMPEEVEHLTKAVNRAFRRMGELIRSQRLLTSAIAHEVRTPLAVLKLELENINHPRARKAEADLDELTEFVAQLTALARLEAIADDQFQATDLAELGEAVVASIAPWVFERGDSIGFRSLGTGTALLVPGLVRDVCRNLIENAVRHSPPGTAILLIAGPGPMMRIRDDGQKPTDIRPSRSRDSLGIGLMIVERVLALHGARMEKTTGDSGFEVTITFNSQEKR